MNDPFQHLSAIYGSLLEQVISHRDLAILSQPQSTFFLCMTADGSVRSNGIYSLWFNDAFVLPLSALPEAFRVIGACLSADVIEQFTKAPFTSVQPFRNIGLRSYQMALLSLFWPSDDQLNEAYYNTGEGIDRLLLNYFELNKGEFLGPQ